VGALDPRLLHRARAARVLLGIDAAAGLVAALLVLAQATLISFVVVAGFDGRSARSLSIPLVLLVGVFAARGALSWAVEVAGRRAAVGVLSQLRYDLVAHRLRSDPTALDGVEAAEVAAASVQGVDALGDYFARYLPQVVLACFVPVAVLAWVARVDWVSAVVMALTLPLVPVFMVLVGRFSGERSRERWDALQQLSSHFLDVVRGLPTLVAYNRGHAQASILAEVGERYRAATMGTLRIAFLSALVLELAATIGVALVAVIVGVRLVGGSLGLQAGLTVLLLAPELYAPLRKLGAEFHATADGLAVAERIISLLEAPPAIARLGALTPPDPRESIIDFERVSYSYPARSGVVLNELDLKLFPGETVALVGESGSGKSTVGALLLRLADPTAGRVAVGGVDLAACDAESWRRLVAWLPQRPLLVRGTVADNIRLGAPTATEERVWHAARLAGAESFVRALPDGLESIIGDGGRGLSAGETQRIALARVFLRDAPLVVLDEPTANLDSENARLVGDVVARLRRGRTVLVISHRPEPMLCADRVVRLCDGRATEHALTRAA
jgi:ATP-binding cassette, subfamily C, bacterial CydD